MVYAHACAHAPHTIYGLMKYFNLKIKTTKKEVNILPRKLVSSITRQQNRLWASWNSEPKKKKGAIIIYIKYRKVHLLLKRNIFSLWTSNCIPCIHKYLLKDNVLKWGFTTDTETVSMEHRSKLKLNDEPKRYLPLNTWSLQFLPSLAKEWILF